MVLQEREGKMAKILTGKEVAASINEESKKVIERLAREGIVPCIGIIRIGENESDISYEKGLLKRCEAMRLNVKKYMLPSDVSEERVIRTIEEANEDENVHGILIFRPLPKHIREDVVLAHLKPEKDVDCVTLASLAGVFTGRKIGFLPCTPEAVIRTLDHYGVDCKGKKAVVIGRSIVVGKPLAMLLLGKNATVTMCHTKTADLPKEAKEADILIAAAGKAGVVTGDFVKEGQIVIDVGINVNEDGKLCGDVDRESVEPAAEAITPVPGGIGSVTTAVLVSHVVSAASEQYGM